MGLLGGALGVWAGLDQMSAWKTERATAGARASALEEYAQQIHESGRKGAHYDRAKREAQRLRLQAERERPPQGDTAGFLAEYGAFGAALFGGIGVVFGSAGVWMWRGPQSDLD